MATKAFSVLLACGVAANAYLAWELLSRLPPSTAEIDHDLVGLADTESSPDSDDPQVKAEQVLSAVIRAQTRDMLEQRRTAALRFVDLRYVVSGVAAPFANGEQLAPLDADIAKQREIVRTAAADVEEVRDGAVRSQRLANLRLAQTTLALLVRRQLMLKYGIVAPSANSLSQNAPAAIDKDTMAFVEADIADRRRVIDETRKNAEQYSGGLIRAVLLQSVATEQMTLAALEQRRLTLKHDLPQAPGLLPVIATVAGPDALATINADIVSTRASIAAGEREASRYSGGLIYVTIISRVATDRMTLAMLEQKRLAIKYGLTTAPTNGVAESRDVPGAVVRDRDAL